jgi:dynein heavy chain, axonemal
MTTKLRNPHYLPEVSTKVTLINFMITYEGLSDQLLGIVVEKENPELQLKKEQLVIESAANKTKLEEIEDQILKVLSNSSDILGDAKGIEILSNAKIVSDDIAKKQVVAEKTEKEIDEARVGYRPVAERTAGLFFCITDLANIDPMYQYSLGFFINLFIAAIANSQPSEDLQERLGYLNAEFLISLYRNICRSLFEKDKLIFSFLLTCKLLEMKNELDYEEFRFFLTGGISLGGELPPAPADWVSEKSWGEILRLEEMSAFKGFV